MHVRPTNNAKAVFNRTVYNYDKELLQ